MSKRGGGGGGGSPFNRPTAPTPAFDPAPPPEYQPPSGAGDALAPMKPREQSDLSNDLAASLNVPGTEAVAEVAGVDENVINAAGDEQRRKARSRAATILTGGRGLMGAAPTLRRTLLGA